MKWDDLALERCSVSQTAAVIGDRWTFLVIAAIFLGGALAVKLTTIFVIAAFTLVILFRDRREPQGIHYLLQGPIVCRDCGFAYCGQSTPRIRSGRTDKYQYYF